jgi:hypothetical protein
VCDTRARTLTGMGQDVVDILEWAFDRSAWWLVGVAAFLIVVWKLDRNITALREWSESRQARTNVRKRDAEMLLDWMAEISDKVAQLERQPAHVTTRMEWGTPGQPVLVIRNRSTRLDAERLDVRVVARDGQRCSPVKVTPKGGLSLPAGGLERLAWPDRAGPANSYVVRLTWMERGRLVDDEDVVWHPSA